MVFTQNTLEKENRVTHAENFVLSQLLRPFILVRLADAFLDAFGSFSRFRIIVTCYNWASSARCGSVSPVCKYVLSIISVTILHKWDETSLTITRIAISLTLKGDFVYSWLFEQSLKYLWNFVGISPFHSENKSNDETVSVPKVQ